jgi:hypothetical protein
MSSLPDDLSRPTHRSGWLQEPELPPMLVLPPVDRLPLSPDRSGERSEPLVDQPPDDVLRRFTARGTRPWSGEPVPLPGAVTSVLWIVLVANIALWTWLSAVRSGAAPCSGWPCSIATLGDHPSLLLMVSGSCVAALAGSAAITRGLSQAGAVPLAVALVGALSGAIALSGVVALLIISAACLAIVLTALVIFIDRL